MARERNPNRDKAFELYKESNGKIQNREIANILGIPEKTVSAWKSRYKWDAEINVVLQKEDCSTTNVKKKNNNDISWLEIENEYVTDIRKNPCSLEVLSDKYKIPLQTLFKYSADNDWSKKRRKYKENMKKKTIEKTSEIISADIAKYQAKHLCVSDSILDQINKALEDPNELYSYVEKFREGTGEGTYTEYTDVKVHDTLNESKVLKLVGAVEKLQRIQRQTLDILSADIKERLAIEREKLELSKPKEEVTVEEVLFTLPANVIAPPFISLNYSIDDHEYLEYVLTGGRGSTKSTFISEKIIELITKDSNLNAVALRQVANTLRDSVYAQFLWSIDKLGLNDKFKCSYSPLEITYKPTGQKIFFRGADDPVKLKGIKVTKGYIGILWYEELDQFKGPEAVRTIQQSVIRGGDTAYIFKSMNPPKTKNNWANKDLEIPKANRLVVHSDYTQIPKSWLGEAFIEEAEHLKAVNPTAYEHEYLGVPNGNGGSIFDNVQIREITDEEIARFDRIYNGQDWGWFPDPWAFNRVHYDAARHTLYVFDEARANKKSNRETYEILVNEKGMTPNDLITCDSSEPKSVQDHRSYGLLARGAIKGPDSVNYSMKWLQSLNAVIIDNTRCPHTATEFLDYEYERDKDGEIISGYPDANNHNIDAIRYATESIWRRKGQ